MKYFIAVWLCIMVGLLGVNVYSKAVERSNYLKAEAVIEKYTNESLKIVPERFHRTLKFYSAALDIPLHVLANLGKAESEWNQNAVGYNRHNNTYDMGVFQLNSQNFEWFSKKYMEGKKFNPYNPKHAIHCGAKYLADLIEQNDGDLYLALFSYNWGIGNVKSGRPIPKCVDAYARKILGE